MPAGATSRARPARPARRAGAGGDRPDRGRYVARARPAPRRRHEGADSWWSGRGTAAACSGSPRVTRPCRCYTGRAARSRSRPTRGAARGARAHRRGHRCHARIGLALVLARDLAQHDRCPAVAGAVADEAIPGWVGLGPAVLRGRAAGARRRPRAAAERCWPRAARACAGVAAAGRSSSGNPAGELILASEGLDLLILGSRRWGPVRRLALGSTSERVIRHSACPVLVPARRRRERGRVARCAAGGRPVEQV